MAWDRFLENNRAFGIKMDADARWLHSKLTSHSIKAFLDPVQLTHGAPPDVVRTFVLCSQGDSPASSVERIRTEPGWQYRELDTGRDAMVTMPRELIDVLLDVVQ